MRYYVEINGNSSLDIIGLAISELPSISKPLQRSNREEIDGRDGDVITKLGYSAYDKTLKIGLWGNYDINDVIAFFDTSGKITFSNEPDKYYYFEILNRADFINQLEAFRTASITIHCQPFKYKEEESPEFEREYVEKTGTSITWDETLEATIKDISLKGNTSQTGTPTPSSPIDVNVVSGNNSVVICGKNLFDKASGIITPGYYDASGNLNTSDATLSCSNIYIPCKPNTSYTISSDTNTLYRLCEYQSDKTYIKRTYNSSPTKSFTITTTANTYFIRMGGTLTSVLNTLQIEESSTASTYEVYNGNTYNIDLPVENLYDKDNVTNGVRIGGIGQDFIDENYFTSEYIKVAPNTTYTIKKDSASQYNAVALYTQNKDFISRSDFYTTTTYTFTTNANTYYIRVCDTNDNINSLKVGNGTEITDYAIELCKIGTYQDYIYKENDKWYKKPMVLKIASYNGETITTDFISTTGELTTGATIYYKNPTENPSGIEITYTPLIEQLNTLEQAQSYEGTTNINQVNNDLPFIITASVLCGSQIFLVHNSGNIVSKPTLTINGSGDIGISLNGNQIFQIALGDEEYITIDVANMEAYKDGVLKNRLVQGDYNNFLLDPGENTISFTGDITSAEILNYSRWI